ncbi:MAG TPA: hypothetical protein PK978_00165 [Paludibacter sp.]|nr:hypothetical protein [Paludibacter sp.]
MKNKYIFLLLLSAVFAYTFTQTFDSKLNLNGDNVHYMQLAKNLAAGNGYSHNTPEGTVPASHYPPGYSAFLAVFIFLGINNLIFFKILNGILLLGGLIGLFYLIEKQTESLSLAFVATALALFSPKILEFASMVMSEIFFFACSVVFFISLYQYAQKDTVRFFKSPWFYLSIIAAVMAYYTRTVGAALIFALPVFFLFRREWIAALSSVAGSVLLIVPWSVRNAAHGIESRYLGTVMTVNPWRPESGNISSVGEMFEKMIVNFDETVIKGFKEILFPFLEINYDKGSGFLQVIGGLIIVAVIFYGAWKMERIKWPLIAYLAAQIGLFMLWHGGNGSRYVVPIAPFLFVGFYVGLYHLILLLWKKEHKLKPHLPYAFLVLIFLMHAPVEAQAEAAKRPHPPPYQNYFTIAREMQKQFPKNVICCCRKPELFSYYAPNIYAVNYKYAIESNELLQDLIQKKVDYVVLEQLGYGSTVRYLYPAITANPELFQIIWHLPNPDTYLLKFEREKAEEKLQGENQQ